jgi:hypothetical protein
LNELLSNHIADEISDDDIIELSNEQIVWVVPLVMENEEDVFEFPNDYPQKN